MRPEEKKTIELLFRAADFETMWSNISNMYTWLGFSDKISDQQRIDEYKWIVQQLRKYMFTKQTPIMEHESITDMLAAVERLIGSAEEYGKERKEVVYNFMRDHWLYEVREALMSMLYDEEEEVE